MGGSEVFGYNVGNDFSQLVKNALANGVVGGITNVLDGGKFGHGFISAGVSAFAKPGIKKAMPGDGGGSFAARVVTRAVIAGTLSHSTGGKFANGAITGAFSQIFNGERRRFDYSESAETADGEERVLYVKGLGMIAESDLVLTSDEALSYLKTVYPQHSGELDNIGLENMGLTEIGFAQLLLDKQIQTANLIYRVKSAISFGRISPKSLFIKYSTDYIKSDFKEFDANKSSNVIPNKQTINLRKYVLQLEGLN